MTHSNICLFSVIVWEDFILFYYFFSNSNFEFVELISFPEKLSIILLIYSHLSLKAHCSFQNAITVNHFTEGHCVGKRKKLLCLWHCLSPIVSNRISKMVKKRDFFFLTTLVSTHFYLYLSQLQPIIYVGMNCIIIYI